MPSALQLGRCWIESCKTSIQHSPHEISRETYDEPYCSYGRPESGSHLGPKRSLKGAALWYQNVLNLPPSFQLPQSSPILAFVRVLILQIFLGLILGGDGYQEFASSNVTCLTEHDVNTIITNWATLYNRPRVFDYDQVIDRTVTNDVIAVDNSFNFLYGLPGEGPYASNKTAFAQIAGTINPAIGNETFKAVDIQYNCKSITLRWQASVEAVGPNEASPNK